MLKFIVFMFSVSFLGWIYLTDSGNYSNKQLLASPKVEVSRLWEDIGQYENKPIELAGRVEFSVSTRYTGGIFTLKDEASQEVVKLVTNAISPKAGKYIRLKGIPKSLGQFGQETILVVSVIDYIYTKEGQQEHHVHHLSHHGE